MAGIAGRTSVDSAHMSDSARSMMKSIENIVGSIQTLTEMADKFQKATDFFRL
jgi:hypothetical protein